MSRERKAARAPMDEAIDRVVAAMTAGTPRPDLARRVVEALETERGRARPSAVRWSTRRLAAVGAAVAGGFLVIATMTRLDRPMPPRASDGVRVASRPEPAAAIAGGERAAAAEDTADASAERSADAGRVRKAAGMTTTGPGPAPSAKAWLAPPMLEPVGVEPLALPDPVRIVALSAGLAPVSPEEIEVEPLRLVPLAERLPWPPTAERELPNGR